MVEGNKKRKST